MSNNNSGLWLSLIGTGVAADRPQIPNVPAGVGAIWVATDTGDISHYVNSAWCLIGTTNGPAATSVDGIVASVTQTLVGATALTAKYNRIATCAHIGDAVKLPAAKVGAEVWVFNDGADAASVFPAAAGDTIDAGAAGAAATITNAFGAVFVCRATGKWTSFGIPAHAA